MRKYNGMPELLEQFMEEQEADEWWVTVQELRDRFGLTRYQCNTVSGFLRRLEFGTFGRFPYIVLRIEQTGGENPSDPPKCRYLVKRKDKTGATQAAGTGRPSVKTNYPDFPGLAQSIPAMRRLDIKSGG
jgi:hypothetical protein